MRACERCAFELGDRAVTLTYFVKHTVSCVVAQWTMCSDRARPRDREVRFVRPVFHNQSARAKGVAAIAW
jgi:acyl dehydratase